MPSAGGPPGRSSSQGTSQAPLGSGSMEPGSLRWLRFQISPPWCEEDQENQNTVYAGTRASCLVRLRELATLSGACTRGDCRAVAGDLRVFIEGRWTDMARVERLLLNSGVLRDDVTGIDVDGG